MIAIFVHLEIATQNVHLADSSVFEDVLVIGTINLTRNLIDWLTNNINIDNINGRYVMYVIFEVSSLQANSYDIYFGEFLLLFEFFSCSRIQ